MVIHEDQRFNLYILQLPLHSKVKHLRVNFNEMSPIVLVSFHSGYNITADSDLWEEELTFACGSKRKV